MADTYPKCKVAAIQAEPVVLDREASVQKACDLIEEAGKNGANIIVLPEGFIPGHPEWFYFYPGGEALAKFHRQFFKNSVEVPSPATEQLGEAARKADAYVVNAHGDPMSAKEAKDLGLEVVDATCRRVCLLYEIVRDSSVDGRVPVLFGKKDHPEVKGVIGSLDGAESFVVGSLADARVVSPKLVDKVLTLLSQTTMRPELYKEVVDYFSFTNSAVCFDTICLATKDRQAEARSLAQRVGSMVVVGGRSSSNTNNLVSVCSDYCPTQHIVSKDELVLDGLKAPVGVTAGASTPDWDINAVVEAIKNY